MQGIELLELAYMEKRRNNLCERLLRFSVDVVLYLRTVKNTIETMDIKRQLIRASTSSAANYEEFKGSPTRPDVKTRIGISFTELWESNYFIKVFDGLERGDTTQRKYLINESEELKKSLQPSLTNCEHVSIVWYNSTFALCF